MDLPYTRNTKTIQPQDIKMTLEELQNIFRHQTTVTEDYKPRSTVDFILINNGNKTPSTHPSDQLDTLLTTINKNGYVFDAYRDRTPIFIVPEIIQPL